MNSIDLSNDVEFPLNSIDLSQDIKCSSLPSTSTTGGHTEHKVRERQASDEMAYMWNLKNESNELSYRAESDSESAEGKGWQGGMNQEFEIHTHTNMCVCAQSCPNYLHPHGL